LKFLFHTLTNSSFQIFSLSHPIFLLLPLWFGVLIVTYDLILTGYWLSPIVALPCLPVPIFLSRPLISAHLLILLTSFQFLYLILCILSLLSFELLGCDLLYICELMLHQTYALTWPLTNHFLKTSRHQFR